MHYSINGGHAVKADRRGVGRRRTLRLRERRLLRRVPRPRATGASPGDSVEVWFSAQTTRRTSEGREAGQGRERALHVRARAGHRQPGARHRERGLHGRQPRGPAAHDGPKYLDEHVAALEANGVTPDVWDVDAQGVPHDLGVLCHYDAALWYLGDNRLTQDPEDVLTDVLPRSAPRPLRRRAAAVPDDRGARLAQRGRQARARR